MKKNLPMMYIIPVFSISVSAKIKGRKQVTSVHTIARKAVLAIASFFKKLKNGSFGAEYKKVITAVKSKIGHRWINLMKTKAAPVKPAEKKARCKNLFRCDHFAASEVSLFVVLVKYQ